MGFFVLLESRTNNGVKFNFISIKKLRVFPIFFFKGYSNNCLLLLLLLYIFFLRSGWSWDHPTLNMAPPLRTRIYCTYLMLTSKMYSSRTSSMHKWSQRGYLFLFFLQKILVNFFLSFFFLLESRTINGAKFNSIGIKKFEGVPKIFLKGIQIDFFLLLYINFFSGQCGLGTTLPLTWRRHCEQWFIVHIKCWHQRGNRQ